MKLLSPRVHGYLDYLLVCLFAAAPSLFGFTGAAGTLCWVVAAGLLALSLLTAYPLGAVRLVSFPAHGALELAGGLALVLAPWILGFWRDDAPRTFYLATGITFLVAWAVTDYRAADLTARRPRRREA